MPAARTRLSASRTTELARDASATDSNRLLSVTQGSASTETVTYDQHGQMDGLPEVRTMLWDATGSLRFTKNQSASTERTWYVYAGAQRVRKVTEKWDASASAWYRWKETAYLGDLEIYRTYTAAADLEYERESLQVTDGDNRVVEAQTETVVTGTPESLLRYSLANPTMSVTVQTDEDGNVIWYEEFRPFGSSAYVASQSALADGADRYRYQGKEKDAETGLSYYGYRYYAPWVARWTCADPGGTVDGLNLYGFVGGNPVGKMDVDGRQTPSDTDVGGYADDQLDTGPAYYVAPPGHLRMEEAGPEFIPTDGPRDPWTTGGLNPREDGDYSLEPSTSADILVLQIEVRSYAPAVSFGFGFTGDARLADEQFGASSRAAGHHTVSFRKTEDSFIVSVESQYWGSGSSHALAPLPPLEPVLHGASARFGSEPTPVGSSATVEFSHHAPLPHLEPVSWLGEINRTVEVQFTPDFDTGLVEVDAVSARGDRFPNLDVVVGGTDGSSSLIVDFQTEFSLQTGPFLSLLPLIRSGDLARFSNREVGGRQLGLHSTIVPGR